MRQGPFGLRKIHLDTQRNRESCGTIPGIEMFDSAAVVNTVRAVAVSHYFPAASR